MEKAKREMRFRFGENSCDASDASRLKRKKMKVYLHNGKTMYTALLYVSRPFAGQPIQEKVHYLFFFHSALRYDSTDTPPRYFPAEVFVKPSRQLVGFYLLMVDELIFIWSQRPDDNYQAKYLWN